MSFKITTLIENMPDTDEKLAYEHGFSVFIEFDGKKILFDTGQTGAFVKNAEVLGVNLSETDAVILSHGHYDHTGGVPELLKTLEKRTPLYIGKEFFAPKYKKLEDGSYKYNGNPFPKELLLGEPSLLEVNFVEEKVTWLTERMVLLKNFSRVSAFEEVNPKFFLKREEREMSTNVENGVEWNKQSTTVDQNTDKEVKASVAYEQDFFVDEIALGLVTDAGMVLIAGCSHVGIVNMLEHIKRELSVPVAAVLGGTHLVEAGEERLQKTVQAFREHGVKTIAVSHCTGENGMELLKKEFAGGFVVNNTGNILEEK
ncbi:MAG: MBL fold metallo-hydrolase [Lachnospiraceae bacterium]|nr:MBL fold metallo-hydrolase [Lachnospiraceae bacterium]